MRETEQLTKEKAQLLRSIADTKRYTVVRLELRSKKEDSLRSTALNHVHLDEPETSMEEVKALSSQIAALLDKGFIHADYELFATLASDYEVYQKSLVYRLLCELVEAGKKRPGFLFDTPYIKRGRLILTPKGKKAVQA